MKSPEDNPKPLDIIRNRIQNTVGEAVMPTEGYASTMAIYGGKLVTDPKGRLVLDRRGIITKLDIIGDYALRTYDEHIMRDPLRLLGKRPQPKQEPGQDQPERNYGRHSRWFLGFLMPGPKRHRGSNKAVDENIKRLGLSEYYGYHPWGIEIKQPEIFTKGIPFQDILRSDLIDTDKLRSIDRFQAVAQVARYMRRIHDEFGGIGEGVPYRFIFQKQEGNQVLDPILFVPDIVYTKSKYATPTDQKATDYLEFLMSIGFEELRRSNDLELVDRVLNISNQFYGDEKIISAATSFARRGRPTLDHPLFSQHNRSHLGFDPRSTAEIRQKVIEACERFRLQAKGKGS